MEKVCKNCEHWRKAKTTYFHRGWGKRCSEAEKTTHDNPMAGKQCTKLDSDTCSNFKATVNE